MSLNRELYILRRMDDRGSVCFGAPVAPTVFALRVAETKNTYCYTS